MSGGVCATAMRDNLQRVRQKSWEGGLPKVRRNWTQRCWFDIATRCPTWWNIFIRCKVKTQGNDPWHIFVRKDNLKVEGFFPTKFVCYSLVGDFKWHWSHWLGRVPESRAMIAPLVFGTFWNRPQDCSITSCSIFWPQFIVVNVIILFFFWRSYSHLQLGFEYGLPWIYLSSNQGGEVAYRKKNRQQESPPCGQMHFIKSRRRFS